MTSSKLVFLVCRTHDSLERWASHRCCSKNRFVYLCQWYFHNTNFEYKLL